MPRTRELIINSAQQLCPATAQQTRKIAQLCVALGIKEPVEEQQMSLGAAGELIRKLSAEVKWRKSPVSPERKPSREKEEGNGIQRYNPRIKPSRLSIVLWNTGE